MALYTSTVKYFWYAINEFLPFIERLLDEVKSEDDKDELKYLLEIYSDLKGKIDGYKLNMDNPNHFYEGERDEIDLNLSDEMIEHLVRLTLRLLNKWRFEKNKLENCLYLTDEKKQYLGKLKRLIWPLEAFFDASGYVLYEYKDKVPLEFPGECQNKEKEKKENREPEIDIFPEELIKSLPSDIGKICAEFNSAFKCQNANACLLLLRKILPLSIVRKFQNLNREADIKDQGEYLETKSLLGKVEGELKEKRIYKDILNHKPLIDGVQHSYTFTPHMADVTGAAIAIRIFLDDLFT